MSWRVIGALPNVTSLFSILKKSSIATAAHLVAERVFPAACVLCETPGRSLCAACRDDATAALARCCARCAIPLRAASATSICGSCMRRTPAYDATFAAAIFAAPFDQLVRGLKYRAQLSFAPLLAELIADRVAEAWRDDGPTRRPRLDLLIPIPLSRNRLAERGFNQALELARPLSKKLGIAVDAASTLRIRDTPPQARLPFDERKKNIRDAFAVRDSHRAKLAGLRIGVVDDVMTTGATLDEFAVTLKRAGAANVVNLVVARTP